METISKKHFWFNAYAWFVVVATLGLVLLGAVVTTKDAGLAVPDWPLSFGSVNPPGWWEMEGVNWEHGHRLAGAVVGLLVIGLMVGIWRVYRNSWVRWLGLAAFVGVCLQGLLGGLRVTEISTPLAVVHGCTAQLFLALLVFIATVTLPLGSSRFSFASRGSVLAMRFLSVFFLLVVYCQLIIGATMRHYKAGLAIPDFPLSFGHIHPPAMSFPIAINYLHRVWGVVVAICAIALLVLALRAFRRDRAVLVSTALLVGMVALQIFLGALIVWQLRAVIPTSFHVVNGAIVLGTGVFLSALSFLLLPSQSHLAGGGDAMSARTALKMEKAHS